MNKNHDRRAIVVIALAIAHVLVGASAGAAAGVCANSGIVGVSESAAASGSSRRVVE